MQQELAKAADAYAKSPQTLANMSKFYTLQASVKQSVADRARQEAREVFQARSKAIKEEAAKFSSASYGSAMSDLRSQYTNPTQMAGMEALRPAANANLGKQTTEVGKLSTAFQKLTVDGNDVHSMARGLASGFNLLWLTWGKLVPLFAGASISFGLKKTFDIGSEVEYQIKFMETLGQTTKEQGKIIRQALRDIDQTTQFSLVELSQAMVRLGQAGQTPAEALATLKPAADLASVGMTDLKVATDLLIQTQALFGKSAADSGKIAAQIFVATKSGVLNVEDIAGSMKYASEANTRFGKSLEETLAILGALAQAGLKGSTGGTAYINFLRDINGRSGPAVKALADLGKATGKTIEVFDSLGKQRSAVDIFNDISNAADKLSAKDADKILSRIFSDRGGRTFFAMVREGTIDLAKMVDVLKEVKPEELLKGAQGLMDTTKGALNILQGAMVGALDKVFEVNSDKFKAFIVDITKAIDSKEFLLSVQSMVAGALSLYETIKSLLPVIEALGTAWLVFKAGSFGVAVFQGLAQALGGMVPMLATTNAQLLNNTKALFTNTGAWQANGIAVVENAAVQRAAAASQAAGAGALSATAVAAAKAGAAATVTTVGMRALTGVIGFMANPIVGVITTLGLLGYAFWSAKKDATASIADTTESVLENGKINIAQWDKEIIRLRERNNLMGQTDGYSGAEAQAKVAQQALALEVKEYERLAKAKDFADRRGSGFSVGDKKRMDELLERIKKGQRDINKVYSDVEAARLKDMSAREEKERQAEAKRNANKPQGSTPLPPSGQPFGGGQKEFDRYADDKSLKAIENQTNSELAALKAGYDAKKVIQDNAYKNMLVSQGQYQADALFSTAQYEEESIQAITQGQEKYFDEFVIKYEELRRLRDGEKVDSTFWKQYNAEMDKAINEEVSYHDAGQAKIVAIREEAAKRIKLSMQDIQGETEKLIKADKEYWVKAKGETAKIAALQKVEEQYRNINQSVFSTATAEKAAALAKSESLENSRQQIEMMKRELDTRKESVDLLEAEITLRSNLALNKGETWAGLAEAKNTVAALRGSIRKLEDQIADGTANAITDGAERGALAYQKEMDAKASAVTDSIAGAIETAIFKSGKEGGKALRDYLQAELIRKPLMAVIKAIIQPISNMVVGGLAGGAANAAAGQAGGSALGSAGGSLMGSALGGIGAFGTGASYGAASLFANGLTGTLAAGGQMIGAGSVMSGLGTIAGALGPIAIGIALLSSLIKKSTPHMGAASSYSAETGLVSGMDVYRASGLADTRTYSAEAEKVTATVAQSIARALDSTATAFGKKAGYEISTAFADDKSKDGAWGSLIIKQMGEAVLDWRDAQTSKWAPKEFADGEQGGKEYQQAIAKSVREVIDGMGLPEWAARITRALPESATMDDLTAALAQIQGYPAQLLQSFGTTRDAMVQQFAQGLQSGNAAAAGQSVADTLVASIQNAIYTNAAGQIFDIVNMGIVTPMLDAIATGASVSEALSQATIDATIKRAKEQASVLAELFGNAEFTQALEQIRTAVGSALGQAGSSIQRLPYVAQQIDTAAQDAAQAATEAANKWQQITDALLGTRLSLAIELLRVQGREEEALAMERAEAIKGMDAYQTGLYDANQGTRALIDSLKQMQEISATLAAELPDVVAKFLTPEQNTANSYGAIAGDLIKAGLSGMGVGALTQALTGASKDEIAQAAVAIYNMTGVTDEMRLTLVRAAGKLADLKDAANELAKSKAVEATDAAMAALEKAVAAQRKILEDSIKNIRAVFEAVRDGAKALYGEVDSTRNGAAAAGKSFISRALADALATGKLPDADALKEALADARSGIGATQYATQFEADKARLVLAGELSQLQTISGEQLTEAEKQLQALDDILANAKLQLDELRGINIGVLSVEAALAAFTAAMGREKAAGGGGGGGQGSKPVDTIAEVLNGSNGAQVDLRNGIGYQSGTGLTYMVDDIRSMAADLLNSGNGTAVYDAIKSQGFTLAQANSILGIPAGEAEAWAQAMGLPIYHSGTDYVPRTGFALLQQGEKVIPAGANQGTTEGLSMIVSTLVTEMKVMQNLISQGNQNTSQFAEQFDNVTGGGNAIRSETVGA